MNSQDFDTFRLNNGMRVVVQSMSGVQSAALTLMVPAGAVFDQPGKSGTVAILSEMFARGTEQKSARELSSAMDNIGLQRSVAGGIGYLTFSAATTADRIMSAVPLIAEQVLTPRLTDEEFGPSRDLVYQSLNALEDEPKQRLGHKLRRCSYPAPWGNPSEGTISDLESIALDDVRQHYQKHVLPNEAVVGIAGNVDAAAVQKQLEDAFAQWRTGEVSEPESGAIRPSPEHIEHDSAQTHIGVAWNTVPYNHDRYFEAWAAISLLSGGMSSRLFTEVREKRGLCYAVSASINTQKDRARVFGYAGTTNERAQETLDVMIAEIRRLHEDITEAELQRCKARAKSALIMQQESTMARSIALARDTLYLGHVRKLADVRAMIDGLTVDQVRNFILDFAPESIVLVTLGPEALDASCVAAPQAQA